MKTRTRILASGAWAALVAATAFAACAASPNRPNLELQPDAETAPGSTTPDASRSKMRLLINADTANEVDDL